MKRLFIVLAWWFLSWNHNGNMEYTGPFDSKVDCERLRAAVVLRESFGAGEPSRYRHPAPAECWYTRERPLEPRR